MKLNVKQLRMLNDISKSEMAKMLNINTLTYSQKENGKTKFYIDEAYKVAEIFEKQIDDIIWLK